MICAYCRHANNSLEYLLKNKYLMDSLYNSLSEYGVIAVPADSKRALIDYPLSPKQQLRKNLLVKAKESGFENAVDFSEASQSFIAIMKEEKSGSHWLSNSAEVNLQLQRRSLDTATGGSPFRFFDGSTMMSYKFPTRIDEEIYCRSDPRPDVCTGHGFDPEREGYPASSFEVKHSEVGEKAGRGVFAKERVPAGSFIGIDDCVNGMYVPPPAHSIIYGMQDMSDYWRTLYGGYLDGYGWGEKEYGKDSIGT